MSKKYEELADGLRDFVVEKRDADKTAVGIMLILGGVVLLVLPIVLSFEDAALYLSCLVGLVMLIFGGVKLLFGCESLHLVGSGARLHEYDYYFQSGDQQKVTNAVENADFAALSQLNAKHSQLPVRLKVYRASDGSFTAMQVYSYVPYEYVPSSALRTFRDADAKLANGVIEGLL